MKNIIYHIRKPRSRAVFCGAVPTAADIRSGWQAVPLGNYSPCQACIDARSQAFKIARQEKRARQLARKRLRLERSFS